MGTMLTGYLVTFIPPKFVLMAIYGLRAVLIVIVVFIPMSITTVMIFSVFFGVGSFRPQISNFRINSPFLSCSSFGYLPYPQQLNL
jgi:hypothetical protein